MTDKQIIIEDCLYFIGGNCQKYFDGVCENHKCDLKIIRELEEKLSNKRKECEELKKENYELTEEVSIDRALFAELDQLKAENKHLNDLLNQALKELEKTRETLTEIKEIAERNIYLKPQLLVYDGDLGQLQHQPIVEILQKISECEVE